jgi:hypothetical protein
MMNHPLTQEIKIIIFYHKQLGQKPGFLIMFLVIMDYLKNLLINHMNMFVMIRIYMANGLVVGGISEQKEQNMKMMSKQHE